MFKSRLADPSLFVNSIATIGELIDEGIFKLEKDNISFIAADRAMVAVVDFKISSTAFEKYELDEAQSIGLNITNFLSVLKRCGSGDKLSLSLQDNKLEVLIENSSKRRFVVPLLDLSQEEVPPIDQLEFTAKATIKPDVLQSGIEDAEIIGDAVLFETSGNKFIMRAEGDVSKAELELERGNEALIDLKADGEIRSRYPLGYLKKMIKASKIADSVSIQFGQDYPMKLEFKAGDKARLTMILAPRVSEE
jgi:proliferating cell nuclear antigen